MLPKKTNQSTLKLGTFSGEINNMQIDNTVCLPFGFLDGTILKVIAVLSMIVDHVAFAFINSNSALYFVCRSFGRLAIPIFTFLLVEGFIHSKNRMQYAMRLGVFAVFAEIPYNLFISGTVLYPQGQNVLFSLLAGSVMLMAYEYIQSKYQNRALACFVMAIIGMIAVIAGCDGGFFCIFNIIVFYLFRKWPYVKCGLYCIITIYCVYVTTGTSFMVQPIEAMISTFSSILIFFVLAIIPIGLYNGKKETKLHIPKYSLYFFYPLHLLLLYLIELYI